jgi:hypothetical protein
MQTCHHNSTDDQIKCKDINTQQLLELLLCQLYQDITNYCSRDIVRVEKHPTDEICHVGRVQPWHAQSYESGCVSPSIHTQNTITMYIFNGSSYHRPAHPPGFTTAQLMLALGVAMAYHLCLRANEYASRTEIPDPESHQFDSNSVEFKFFKNNVLLSTNWHNLEVICFTIQHAKNFKKGHGVPIWFSTKDPNEDVSLNSYIFGHVQALDNRMTHCLVYKTVHAAIATYASVVQTPFYPNVSPDSFESSRGR